MDGLFWNNPLIIPLAAFLMVVIIVAIGTYKKTRERELLTHQELRLREMEHERKMKELEIEKLRLELEKARTSKSV
jgi:Na+/melibiose symporter-like transporter